MSVNFSTSSTSSSVHPANSASAGNPVGARALHEAFAAVLRGYGTETGGRKANTMLEILFPTSQADSVNGNDPNQQSRESRQRENQNDFSQIDRKLLNKSEVRQSEMNADYQNRKDRNEIAQNDYLAKTGLRQLTARTETSVPSSAQATPQTNATPSNIPLPNSAHSPQQQQGNISVITSATSQTSLSSPTAPNPGAVNGLASIAMNMNAPVSMPVPTIPQVLPLQTFTLFTPLGRLGQHRDNSDEGEQKKEDDDENEESVEGEPAKKKGPFAVLSAIYAEQTRSVQKFSRQLKESPPGKAGLSRTVEKPCTKPREMLSDIEQLQVHGVTPDELLNTLTHNVSVSKRRGESNQPNQSQYIHRIAAACEAAAQYAPIRIKINLDHLGTLTLRFYHKADKLALRFETPTKESAQFLQENLKGLKGILSKRNVQIVSLEVLPNELP